MITLTAVSELHCYRWEVARCLVIAPLKVAESTWISEAAKWDHLQHLRVIPVLGSSKKRLKALDTPGDVWVINRENVTWLVDHYREKWPFDMVVLDESSSFKNSQSKRFRSLRLVRSRIRRLVELTGTPAPNGLEDLWAQIWLLDGGQRLGRTISSFRDAFFIADRMYPGQTYQTYTPQKDAAARIQTAISDICVSMKAEDYLELPPFIEDAVPVALDETARRVYDRMERDMLLQVDDQTITAGSAAVLNGKLLQLASGAVYDVDGHPAPIHACKIEAFLEVLEQLQGEHILVFYWFVHERERLIAALRDRGLRYRVYSGPEDEQDWNEGRVDVMLAHPASCAYGLNLQQGGHHIVWFGWPNWTLELYQQANARLYRQGQTKPVIVHQMAVQGTMDEAVVAALHAKGDTQDNLMEALKAKIRRARDGKLQS